ncbi:MAG: alpha/beta fold hydrolase [Candidatus Ancaeobacter aquaticus]|nr:alpha/beta fold hydrolase [Candidatus Ancaeobacter aquaticus]
MKKYEKHITIQSTDEVTLSAILTLPEKKTDTVVIMAHGITANKEEGGTYSYLSRLCASEEHASLRFDFRGHGQSSGAFSDVTIKGEKSDLSAVIAYLKKQGYKKCAVVATSFGAGIALLSLKKYRTYIKSMTLLCPVLDYRRTFLEPETKWARKWFHSEALAGAKKRGSVQLGEYEVSYEMIKELRKHKHKPAETLLCVGVPCLIIHGDKDSMVPHSVSEHYGRKHTKGKFISIKNADHGLSKHKKDFCPKIIEWINAHFD